jgi:hypothetical protein
MPLIHFILPALLAPLAATGGAADLATIDCVGDHLDAATRERLVADVERNLLESGKRPSYAPEVSQGIAAASARCMTDRGWSVEASRSAGIYALAKLGLPVAQRVLADKGFDPAALEDQFQALPQEVRDRPITAAETQQLLKDAPLAEEQQTRENAEMLGEYFAILNTLQYAATRFPQA